MTTDGDTGTETALKVRRIIRGGKPGPWHVVAQSGSQPQAWCGSKMTGFNHRETTTTIEQVIATAGSFGQVCPKCVAAVKTGRRKAYRS